MLCSQGVGKGVGLGPNGSKFVVRVAVDEAGAHFLEVQAFVMSAEDGEGVKRNDASPTTASARRGGTIRLATLGPP